MSPRFSCYAPEEEAAFFCGRFGGVARGAGGFPDAFEMITLGGVGFRRVNNHDHGLLPQLYRDFGAIDVKGRVVIALRSFGGAAWRDGADIRCIFFRA